jgi:DnaJ-domain-containing protein 1
MKQQSKLFDNIRIRARKDDKPQPVEFACEWEGCTEPGEYRAPKGPRTEGQYHHFCLEHVRHYNKAFNFFAGMSQDELDEALTTPPKAESRSTFATGNPQNARASAKPATMRPGDKYGDPFGVFAKYRHRQAQTPAAERVKPMTANDKRAFESLGFSGHAKSDDIKAAYKNLVKIHHPDVNGGDRSSEEKLRTIIAAYSHLKKMGFVVR